VTDRIKISRLAIYGFHGVHAEEKRLGQRFYISLSCSLDLAPAGRSDDFGQSVCYGKLAELVHGIATERRFHIIEALAETIAEEILAQFHRIQSVTVTVEKPEAPVPFVLDGVAVEIERHRHG
jgi:dihydroneopterin aldolase